MLFKQIYVYMPYDRRPMKFCFLPYIGTCFLLVPPLSLLVYYVCTLITSTPQLSSFHSSVLSIPLAHLLHTIHHSIQQTHHFVADKTWIVSLDKVAAADRGNGANGLAFLGNVAQLLVVAAPCGVRIRHCEGFGSVERRVGYHGLRISPCNRCIVGVMEKDIQDCSANVSQSWPTTVK